MKELEKYLKKYAKTFGEGFPTYQLARGRSPEEVIEIIKRCIDVKKDVYELGLVTLDEDTEY